MNHSKESTSDAALLQLFFLLFSGWLCPRNCQSLVCTQICIFSFVRSAILFTAYPELIPFCFLFQRYCLSQKQEEGAAKSMVACVCDRKWSTWFGPQQWISLQISGEPVISVLCQGSCRVPITIDFSIKLCSTFPNIACERSDRELAHLKFYSFQSILFPGVHCCYQPWTMRCLPHSPS